MKTENAVLMRMARESLTGKWGLAVGTFLIYILITAVLGGSAKDHPTISLISLILNGPLSLGAAIFSLSLARNEEAGVEQIFFGFYKFGKALATYLLMMLFIVLWALPLLIPAFIYYLFPNLLVLILLTLLFIIPAVIAALSYSMTFYIMADDGSIGAMEAIDKSKAMMYAYKWKLFCLGLRFLLWSILCILTLGIGFLWLIPWMNVTMAKFYDDIK
jgi:uncharacterized membrane protein